MGTSFCEQNPTQGGSSLLPTPSVYITEDICRSPAESVANIGRGDARSADRSRRCNKRKGPTAGRTSGLVYRRIGSGEARYRERFVGIVKLDGESSPEASLP